MTATTIAYIEETLNDRKESLFKRHIDYICEMQSIYGVKDYEIAMRADERATVNYNRRVWHEASDAYDDFMEQYGM